MFPFSSPFLLPFKIEVDLLFFWVRGGGGRLIGKGNVFHLKLWSSAFSNLRSHNVLGPLWHWAALTVKFCASKSLLVFENFLMLLQPLVSSPSFLLSGAQDHFCWPSWHPPFRLVGRVFGERPHDLSGSTQCLRYPASSACIPQPPLILFLQPSSPWLSLCLSPWKLHPEWSVPSPFKPSLFLSSSNDGAKSHPELTPTEYFPHYFTENTKQKCHFKRGVFFFLLECKLLKSRDNVFCMFYCA